MTKTEFLTHLDKRLQVLKQKEREDILGEYAQHIELKMENGLSEEEAIRDFGDLEELTDEILDAYNVDPSYGRENQKPSAEKLEALGKSAGALGKKTGKLCKQAGNGLASLGGSMGNAVCRLAAACKAGFLRLIHWRPVKHGNPSEDGAGERKRSPGKQLFSGWFKREGTDEIRERRSTTMWTWMCHAGNRLARLIGGLVFICWRLCVLMFLAPFAFGSGCAVIGLGVLLVLVALGYPLIGVTIMTVGALLCGVTMVWFVWGLIFGKKEEKTWESEEH